MKVSIVCGKCGGTTTVNVRPNENSAAAECACGAILLWAREPSAPTLGISIGEHVRTEEKIS